MNVGLSSYLTVSGLLFAIGFFGLLLRRNSLITLMSLEIMLNASNLALVSFSRFHAVSGSSMMSGNIFVFFVITVAAAEVAVGLAIIVALFRRRQTIMVDALNELRD